MNAANLCPSPRMVSDRVAELTRDIDSGIAHRNPVSPDQWRDAFLGAFTPRTRVVALTHVSSLTGVRLPVHEICQEARRERIASIWPFIVEPGQGTTAQTSAKGAAKFETLGQSDDACLAGLDAAMDFHAVVGPAQIENRVLELAAGLEEGLHKVAGVRS